MKVLFLLLSCSVVASAGTTGAQAQTAGCAVRGTVAEDDRQLALAACNYARERTALLFGQEAAPALVHVTTDLPGGFALLVGDTVRLELAGHPGPPADLRTFANMIGLASHELGHGLFLARSGTSHVYGPDRGDWFMEAAAVWSEHPDERRIRLAQALRDSAPAIELRRLIRMHHPTFRHGAPETISDRFRSIVCSFGCPPGRPDTLVVRDRLFTDGTQVTDTVAEPTAFLRERQEVSDFYATAYALLAFIHERGGAPAVRQVEREISAGRAPGALEGLPGLPPRFDRFAAEFAAWLRGRHREAAKAPGSTELQEREEPS